MPCCQSLLSVAASGGGTPSWLHRLHAKEGLSFPSHLHIDDLYAHPPPPPPPPLPSSNHHHLAVVQELTPKARHPKPKQQPHPPRARSNNPSPRPNPPTPQPPPPPLPLSAVVFDLSAAPSDLPPLKPLRKKPGPRPRADKDKKPRNRKRRRPADSGGERSSRTELTVFDSSVAGWKACKLLVRKGGVWKIRDWKLTEVSEPEDLTKGKRKAGLTTKIKRDRQEKEMVKEKEAASRLQENIHGFGGFATEYLGDPVPIQTLKWPGCSEPVSEDQSAGILHLQSASRVKNDGLANPKGDLK